MGMMIAGRWSDEDRQVESGAFVREASVFGGNLSAKLIRALGDEPGRFHLIASASCPWSHRTIMVRVLKGLTVPLQIAHGTRREGYPVNGGRPWRLPGSGREVVHLHQVYSAAAPDYSGRVTVPVLWDGSAQRIVSNESAKILRAFDAVCSGGEDLDFTLVPQDLRGGIDRLNARIQEGLSEAVYRAGMARRQGAYDAAVGQVFDTLAELESRLADRRYLLGSAVTEADWRLFASLVRFDSVYHTHFRCTRRRLVDYPHLWAYARDLYAWRGIAESVDFDAIREGYYANDGDHNPSGIVAAAPEADWHQPHSREILGAAAVVLRDGRRIEVDPTQLAPLEG